MTDGDAESGEKTEGEPWDDVIGGMGVKLPKECVLCGDFRFAGWNVLHGEANCRCGAVYQLRPTSEGDWSDVPRHKMADEYLDACKEKVEQDGNLEGFDEWHEEEWGDD